MINSCIHVVFSIAMITSPKKCEKMTIQECDHRNRFENEKKVEISVFC